MDIDCFAIERIIEKIENENADITRLRKHLEENMDYSELKRVEAFILYGKALVYHEISPTLSFMQYANRKLLLLSEQDTDLKEAEATTIREYIVKNYEQIGLYIQRARENSEFGLHPL